MHRGDDNGGCTRVRRDHRNPQPPTTGNTRTDEGDGVETPIPQTHTTGQYREMCKTVIGGCPHGVCAGGQTAGHWLHTVTPLVDMCNPHPLPQSKQPSRAT